MCKGNGFRGRSKKNGRHQEEDKKNNLHDSDQTQKTPPFTTPAADIPVTVVKHEKPLPCMRPPKKTP